jgi:hypothetical protein
MTSNVTIGQIIYGGGNVSNQKLSDLTPNERNPRVISEKEAEMLQKSLSEFGDLGGICFNRTTSRLFGGHQRVKVLPPDSTIVIMQHYDSPTPAGTVAEGHVLIAGEKFKYREVEWDEQKEKAAMIAANKHGGQWDKDLLSELVQELNQADYDSELFGYEEAEVEKLIQVSSYERAQNGDAVDDLSDEWKGMPEFTQNDARSFRHVVVHFENEEDAKSFFDKIEFEDTGKTKSMWYPPKERNDLEAKRYGDEESEQS